MDWWLFWIVALTFGAFLGPWLLAKAARRWGVDEEPSRGYRYTFQGHDEQLQQRTQARRQQAASIRRQSVRIETRDDRPARFQRVG